MATKNRIRVGVVGLGAFGSHHARHYAGHPDAEFVAVADADEGRARAAAEKYGAVAYGDHRALIGKVDAASVTVPATLHFEIACDLMEAGVHLFVEKPITPDAASAEELVALSETGRLILQVGHIERFSPAFRELARRVAAPQRIETVRRSTWNGRSTDVDVVLDLMVHDIDLALTLAGAPVAQVVATGTRVRGNSCDVAEATLTFANGAVASLSASRVAERPERTLRAEDGTRTYVADLGAVSLSVASDGRTEAIAVAPADALGLEIAAFLDSVATGKPPLVGGNAGLEAVAVAERILGAIAENESSLERRTA